MSTKKRLSPKPKLVTVDDQKEFLTVLHHWLSPEWDVTCLSDGQGLLDILDDVEPEVLLLDVRMPSVDGFTLCEQVRADPRFSGLPVVFLTGCQEDADFVENLQVGGTAYLPKAGMTQNALRTAIRQVLGALSAR